MLLLDDLEALTALHSVCEVVLVGGSLLPSPAEDGSSSPAPAAVAGCAILMGPYGGRQLTMASELNHAALVASEEAAAAVSSTVAALLNHSGLGGEATPGPASRRDSADRAATHDGAHYSHGGYAGGMRISAAGLSDGWGRASPDGSGSLGHSGWQRLAAEALNPAVSR